MLVESVGRMARRGYDIDGRRVRIRPAPLRVAAHDWRGWVTTGE